MQIESYGFKKYVKNWKSFSSFDMGIPYSIKSTRLPSKFLLNNYEKVGIDFI